MLNFLNGACQNGEVVLSPPRLQRPGNVELPVVSALTRCRTLYNYNDVFLPYLVSKSEMSRRRLDMEAFWQSFSSMEIRYDILKQYNVAYLVIDHTQSHPIFKDMNAAKIGSKELKQMYHNDRFSVFKVTE